MRKLVLAFAVLALARRPSRRGALDETEHVSRTVKLDPGGTLRLKSFSGRVTITASDRPEVVIDAVRRALARAGWTDIKLDIHTDGSNVVVVDANRRDRSWFEFIGSNNVVDTDFDIKVPRRTNLDVVGIQRAGDASMASKGRTSVHGFSSRLSLDDVGRPDQGAHLQRIGRDSRESRGSRTRRSTSTPSAATSSCTCPKAPRGSVTFNSFSGHLNSEMPLTLQSSQPAHR